MNRVFLEIKERNFISPSQAQQFLPSPPNIQSNSSFDLNSKISPSILLIIIILSIIFFLSGLLHLLVRFLLTPSNREQDEYDNVTALQGQLQQLFHLHDSGVDQSFIDTLPVFHYKSIIGLKNPFDCAVCLCEFEPEDKLRLLPKCSHAFHMDCIDTWLLSHSTCPLCRSSLLSNFSPQSNSCSPFVLVLESGSDSSREIATDCDSHTVPGNNSVHGIRAYPNSHLSCDGNSEFGSTHFDSGLKTYDFSEKEETFPESDTNLGALGEEKVVAVRLGKFRNVDDGGQCSNNANDVLGNRNIDERRCFSMGACEYVMEEESTLRVHVSVKNQKLHRAAMSECDGDSIDRFKFNEFGSMRSAEEQANGNVIEKNCRKESFSISKIWLKGDKKKHNSVEGSSTTSSSSLRRAFSFRFPVHTNSVSADSKGKNKPGSGEEIAKRENSESLETKTPSFARRAALWLVGRQNKVVHSSSAPFV